MNESKDRIRKMIMSQRLLRRIMATLLLASLPALVTAQSAKVPFHKEAYFLDTGIHSGQQDSTAFPSPAYSGLIINAGAPWLRLRFGDYHLDSLSYIIITSLEDRGWQRLDATSMRQWHGTSAMFNGSALGFELYVAPGDSDVFVRLDELFVGERVQRPPLGKSMDLCGADDRVSSDSAAVGRLLAFSSGGDTLAVCSGWIASNGANVTAGHCFVEGYLYDLLAIFEFNVPPSEGGDTQWSHPNDQYSIDSASVVEEHTRTPGNDWGLFRCEPNSNTGLLPVQAQQAFFRLKSGDLTEVTTARLIGYGSDGTPPEADQTQQTSTGPFEDQYLDPICSEYCWVLEYDVDEEGGNSGSPVIDDDDATVIGIHNDGYCLKPNGHSVGTSLKNSLLESALQDFPGSNVKYADSGHPELSENGSIFKPYSTVGQAVTAVPSGGIVSIVTGAYNESITINTAMTLTAPVGIVAIGTSFLPKSMPALAGEVAAVVADAADGLIPAVYSLAPNYPNPFNPATTIRFGLPEDVSARLVVYDLMGREVARLLERSLAAGYHSIVWNGKNAAGAELPSGLYIARLSTPRFTRSIKMVLLK